MDIIRDLVESYMKIVHKTQRDLVPKMIMHVIVNEVRLFLLASKFIASLIEIINFLCLLQMKHFLKGELLPCLYQAGDIVSIISFYDKLYSGK